MGDLILKYSDLSKDAEYKLNALSLKFKCDNKDLILKALDFLYEKELKWDVDINSTFIYYFVGTRMHLGKLVSKGDKSITILTPNNKLIKRVKNNVFFTKKDALVELHRLKVKEAEATRRGFELFF